MNSARKIGIPGFLLLVLAACSPLPAVGLPAASPPASTALPGPTASSRAASSPSPQPSPTFTPTPPDPGATLPIAAPSATPLPALSAEDWKSWPEVPVVPGLVSLIYQTGQQMGNDPHAFSVLGDCQSQPDLFLGIYDRDPQSAAGLPAELQETVANFAGSFDRPSPTVRGGTTAAALLWPDWTQGKYGCRKDETPLTCELRIHRPSFAILHVGTHYEEREINYLNRIIAQLISRGVVPLLATKADDREGDERVNRDYAVLAVQYNLPLWNFWAATSELPDRGLYTRTEVRYQGDVYLTEAARAIHRYSALQALNAVWRAAAGVP
jgi:hypothetical protein